MPAVWKVSANHRHYPGTATFPMAHIGNRYILLEKAGLSDSGRCILKVHHSEEITKFHLSSCVHRAIYDLTELGLPHIIRSDNSPCYNSKEFQQFFNVTASHTKPVAQTISDLMDLLREWLELPRS